MPQKRKDRIFPGESVLLTRSEHSSVYRLDFADGYGTMTAYTVMPGVTLIFNDFHTSHEFPGESRCPGMIEINHCRTGRYECTMGDGRIIWLGSQDFAVSDMGRPPVHSRFSQKLYQGISLVVEPEDAEQALFRMLGEGAPKLTELFQSMLSVQSFLLLRSDTRIQHIFAEMYEIPAGGAMAYYRLKTAELMFFLYERHKAARSAEGGYHSRNMTALRSRSGTGIRCGNFYRQKVFSADLRRIPLCPSETKKDGGGRVSSGHDRAEYRADRRDGWVSEYKQIFGCISGYLRTVADTVSENIGIAVDFLQQFSRLNCYNVIQSRSEKKLKSLQYDTIIGTKNLLLF